VVGLIIFTSLSRQSQEIPESSAAPESIITLLPSTTTPLAGDTFTVDVDVNTFTNEVGSARIDIDYSTDAIEIVSVDVIPGSFFTNPGEDIDSNSTTNTIAVHFLPPPTDSPVGPNATGTLATLTFLAQTAGQSANINLVNTSYLGAIDNGLPENVILGTTPSINISVAALSPTPTLVPTSAPTPTPTPIPLSLSVNPICVGSVAFNLLSWNGGTAPYTLYFCRPNSSVPNCDPSTYPPYRSDTYDTSVTDTVFANSAPTNYQLNDLAGHSISQQVISADCTGG